MRNPIRRSLTLVITFVALTVSLPAGSVSEREELDTLLARYDRGPEGAERDRLAARIDAIAHQKYATVSRLYWHIDLEAAKAAARAQGLPILHLRMLGRLDEDLSCANSRLFRATLYANRELSAFLRERFVLYWSSERPVPRVTIDYGDGRRIERTIAGNSAHYVFDEDGQVLDVLPGLYAPAVFRQELEQSLALHARMRSTSAGDRARLVADHHQQRVSAVERDWKRLVSPPMIVELRGVAPSAKETPAIAAQRITATKMASERIDLRVITTEAGPETLTDGEIEKWSARGRRLYDVGVLDATSRALVVRLHNAGSQSIGSDNAALSAMLARLQQTIVADTALNQLQVRPQISREIARRTGRVDFESLNAWIYDQVFRTPRQDPWLGLLQRGVFTGLPGDGVSLTSLKTSESSGASGSSRSSRRYEE